jgi:hypothetical protein
MLSNADYLSFTEWHKYLHRSMYIYIILSHLVAYILQYFKIEAFNIFLCVADGKGTLSGVRNETHSDCNSIDILYFISDTLAEW